MKLIKYTAFFTITFLLISQLTTAQLQAGFSTDKTGGCSPVAISFTNTSKGTSANTVYKWDFGNGNTSSSLNAGAIYTDEKDYTVTLTIQEGANISVSTKTISVYVKPVVNDIIVSPVKGCLPLNTTFTASAVAGSGSVSSYFWDFGDGNTLQGSSSQPHTYTVPQTASVSLTVTNSFGCSNALQKNNIVEILPAINASFSASQTILCRVTDAVQFTNSSYGPGTLSYLWNFGDGTSSTVKEPAHSFNKKGIYTVTLTVTSSEGCSISNTQTGLINVASFNSDFTGPSHICKGDYLTFNNASSPYTNNSAWEVDGLQVYNYYSYINYVFNTTGDHTIKLKNIFGTCPDSVIKTVTVKDIPYPNGFLDTLLSNCGAPTTVHFKDTTANVVKWEWNFGLSYNSVDATTPSASYTYQYDGGYYASVKVTNADGCSASINKYIGITEPSVSINANSNRISCGPFKLIFTASTTDSLISYNWHFSDGTSSTEVQPEHLFSAAGTYSVTLTYTTKSGCTGTVSYGDIEVHDKPTANFSANATTLCGNTPVVFSATPQGDYANYYWYFGDSNYPGWTYYTTDVSHQYNYDSTYTVTLIVINRGNCSDTMTKKDYIKVLPPFPKITGAVNTCDGTRGLVSFTQASQKANSWTWDFGDGNTTALNTDQPGVMHTYTKTGTYKTVLITTNGQCTVRDSITTYVLLKQNPVFTVSPSEICAGQQFNFQINNIDYNPTPYNYSNNYNYVKWEYSDGTLFNGYFYDYNYWTSATSGSGSSNEASTRNVRVIFRSEHFYCDDTTNFVLLKFKGASAGFEVIADKQCWRQPVIFNDTSKVTGSSQIIKRDWNFGDGTVQSFTTGGTITHNYSNPGNYNVTLTVTDAGGCVTNSTSSKYVDVDGPKAAFNASAYNTTITLPVYFYNNTNNYNSYITQYQWSFGDGNTSTDYNPSHAYTNPGKYTVTLVAFNPTTQCGDTVSQIIQVMNFAPAFTLSNMDVTGKCPPVLVRFSNNSINYTRVTWDFGDGTTADNLNYPSHVYETPGKYIVTLYVYGVSGLQATYIDSVIVKQPSGTLRTDTSELCIGGSANLTASVTNSKMYLWDFGDGNLSATADSTAAHTYNTAGVYKPAIMVTDTNGCSVLEPLSTTINVHSNPEINFSPLQPVVCKGTPLQIKASGGDEYQWTPATGLDNPAIASPFASPDINTVYTVSVKDNIGCSNKATINVIVAQPFNLKAPADTTICSGKSVLLPVAGADSYNWINNTTGLSNTQSPNPVAAPQLTTEYTVTGADQYKCFTDTVNVTVKIVPLPVVNAGPDQEVQSATPVQLSVQTDNDVIKWNWSPAMYLNCSDCSSPICTPLGQTSYIVSVTNRNGCVASDTIIVKVLCQQNTVRIPNAFTPNNDGNNDVFMIKGISLVKHLVIYGRWGEKIFERSNFIAGDRSSCWDGTYKGNPATEGSYVYYAEMQCPTGGVFMMKGSVVLIR